MRVITADRRTIRSLLSTGCVLFLFLPTSSLRAAEPASPAKLSAASASSAQVVAFAAAANDELAKAPGVCRTPGRDDYIALIRSHAGRNALPAHLADAVTYVESRYRPEKIGKAGEIGLMQIRPATAAMLGFRGSDIELAEPSTNIRYGVAYLARAWRLAKGDLCRAFMKYRAGLGERRMSRLSVKYCGVAKTYLRKIDAAQTAHVSSADPDGATSLVSLR